MKIYQFENQCDFTVLPRLLTGFDVVMTLNAIASNSLCNAVNRILSFSIKMSGYAQGHFFQGFIK